jgi:hypothetical protein
MIKLHHTQLPQWKEVHRRTIPPTILEHLQTTPIYHALQHKHPIHINGIPHTKLIRENRIRFFSPRTFCVKAISIPKTTIRSDRLESLYGERSDLEDATLRCKALEQRHLLELQHQIQQRLRWHRIFWSSRHSSKKQGE